MPLLLRMSSFLDLREIQLAEFLKTIHPFFLVTQTYKPEEWMSKSRPKQQP